MNLKNLYLFLFVSFSYIFNAQTAFVTRWNTNANNDNSKQLVIGLKGSYDYFFFNERDSSIEGNGNSTGTLTLELPEPDIYYIFIIPNSENLGFKANPNNNILDAKKLIEVIQWGDFNWETDLSFMFADASNLVSVSSLDIPNFFNVTSMKGMFKNASNFNSDLSSWETSSVSDMSEMFYNASKFNQSLENFNLKKLLNSNLQNIFKGSNIDCQNFNRTLKGWANSVDTPFGINVSFEGLKYGSEGKLYRDLLINTKGWNITDDFLDLNCNSTLNLGNETNSDSELKIVPNPTKGLFNIISQEEIKSIGIYSIDGKFIKEIFSKKINIDNFKNGYYILKINFLNGKSISKKLIKY